VRFRYEPNPHPHLVIDEIVEASIYEALTFPDHLVARDDPWGIAASDPEYAKVLSDPSWRALHDQLRGEPFVHTVLAAFGDEMRAAGCLVDPDRARIVNFIESREEKAQRVLAADGDPNEIFTRLDFQSKAEGGYRDFVHLDWARRIVGGILFFSDARDEGLEGGELALYRDRAFRNDRWCHDPELLTEFRPRHNSGVIFLNSNSGFHGPRPIRSLSGRRRWLYFTISSTLDVWPCAPREGVPA
jgi:hypothetical protein